MPTSLMKVVRVMRAAQRHSVTGKLLDSNVVWVKHAAKLKSAESKARYDMGFHGNSKRTQGAERRPKNAT